MNCERDWYAKFGEQAINHFGRIVEPIRLTEENAWTKDYDYDWRAGTKSNWRWLNILTDERRPMTKEQYNDDNLVRP